MGSLFGSIITSLLLSFFTMCYAYGSSPRRVVTNIIHRDSVLSPYYNPKETITDRSKRFLEISAARLAYFETRLSSLDVEKDIISFGLVPSFPMLFVNISIGDPPVPQLTVMDTGSNLLWVQCLPPKNGSQASPVFDPIESSTYSEVACDTLYCTYAPSGRCGSYDRCVYHQTYMDGPFSRGELAKERMTFETSDEGTVTVSNVVFGCGQENGMYGGEKYAGIMGLGSQLISVVARLGSAFSYCIGSLLDPHYQHHKLILGEGAIFEGDSTPVRIVHGLYHVTLEGISFGEKALEIDLGAYIHSRRSGESVIDSGTAVTWLVPGAYRALLKEVKALLEGILVRVEHKPLTLCYRGSVTRDLVGFPVVTLHFSDGAELALDTGSLFYQAGDVFCMAVAPSKISGLSIIGLMAQQYYNIAYDVAGGRAYFQRIECELLDD